MHQLIAATEQPFEWESPTRPLGVFQAEHPTEWSTDPGLLAYVRLARQLARSSRASLLLPDSDGVALRLVAAVGLPDDLLPYTRASYGQSVAGIVAQERRSLLVNDEHDFRGALGPTAPPFRALPFVSVPVPLSGGASGALNVTGPLGRAIFRDADVVGLQDLAQLIGASLPAMSVGEQLRQQEAVIAQLQQQLIEVQERERQRLARELHDEAGHALTIALLRVDLERVKATTAPATREALTQARDAIMEAATALNDMAFRLRPRILEDLGLLPALRTLAIQAQEPGRFRVTLEVEGERSNLHSDVELAAFRVVQEALTNTRKHAGASKTEITLSFLAQSLRIVVQDDGVGFDRQESQESGQRNVAGQGVRGMRERVEVTGGTLAIETHPEGGTRVVATLPLQPRRAGDD